MLTSLFLIAVLTILGPSPAWAAEAKKPDGAALYAASCASCHAKTGKGNPALGKAFKLGPEALDLVDKATMEKPDEDLKALTEKGMGKMPGYKGKLTDEQLSAVLAHVRSLAPKPKAEKP